MPKQQSAPNSKTVALVSFVVDLSDILLNLFVAILSNSVILTSQWLQGFADLISSGLILFGVKQAGRKPDKKHPFGYGRELFFWTLMATMVMITLTTGLTFYFGWRRLLFPEVITDTPLAISILLIGFISNSYACYLSYKRLATSSKDSHFSDVLFHSSLIETRTTFVLDLTGALASLVGFSSLLIYQITGNSRIDGLGTLIIAFILAFLALILLFSLHGLIIGQSVDHQTEALLIKTIESFPQVYKVLDLRTSIIGPQKFLVNVEIHVDEKLKTEQIEKLMDQIKQQSIKIIPQISHIQVELETPDNKPLSK